MKKLVLVSTVLSALFSVSAFAANIDAGKAKSVMCAGCHGMDGKALIPTYPNLAGQNEAYLVSALKAYKAGERTGTQAGIMAGMAAALSDEDVANVAAYFASLK
ncbi:c-type cytochrome [Algibacillus agarilyticus]|uniref:c-type cytochrome n=1 Tax=Algibacillus agarilyticus TaxID=2234133 RepID=UPI000DCFD7BE|nr:cytochrome c [Algibacillus agarilyticus]